jgi:hypothetical protein
MLQSGTRRVELGSGACSGIGAVIHPSKGNNLQQKTSTLRYCIRPCNIGPLVRRMPGLRDGEDVLRGKRLHEGRQSILLEYLWNLHANVEASAPKKGSPSLHLQGCVVALWFQAPTRFFRLPSGLPPVPHPHLHSPPLRVFQPHHPPRFIQPPRLARLFVVREHKLFGLLRSPLPPLSTSRL